MGAGFDEMTERSHPRLEAQHLANHVLAPFHVRNRDLLRHVMGAGGFRGIASEWWHFEMLDRQHVRQHFTRVD
jgi:zinc D-Ala-D-Ala dipeptidase